MSEHGFDLSNARQRRTLIIVLVLNVGLAAGFAVAGVLADSSALIANALDNASDSLVSSHGSEPNGAAMMAMALIGAAVNALCFWLLERLRKADANIRAARTFSANDFAANVGILVAGALVLWTGLAWPDLLVGVAVAALAIKGGIDIVHDAHDDKGRRKAGR